MGGLEIRLLGEFKLLRDGEELEFPPSRKTRALLAWLLLHRRRYRREQLCELLWEVPDDPRGALRWSLSKLRRLLDEPGRTRVLADRTGVEIDATDVAIDVTELHALVRERLATASLDELEAAAARFRGNFLEGLEFSGFHQFHAWCVAEREQAARAQARVLKELVSGLEGAPERALPHARALVDIAPYDEACRALLIRLLHRSRRVEEAHQQYELGMRMLKEAGLVSSGVLLAALRGGADAAEPARPARPVPPAPADEDASVIGRDAERRQLQSALAQVAAARSAEVLLVLGEPGIGKTHLLGYAAGLARGQGARVLEARAYECERVRPFALWTDALRECDEATARRVFQDNEADNRDRLFSRLAELVRELGEAQPLTLLFDDVHWCDESSAAALHYVLRTNRDRPLLAVLAARDGELLDNPALQQTLRGLRNAGLLHELTLGPLSDASTARLIAAHAPDADIERLSKESGGNPLFAIELARAGSGASTAPLNQLVRERLARFDLHGMEVLRWAALLGPHIDVPKLATLSGLDPARVASTLEAAEHQGILVSDGPRLRFWHELIARAVYADISPVRRQVMHRRIAEMMEQDSALDPGQASELAYHATQSGDPKLAARALVSAGRLCLRYFANREALSLARRGLELADALSAADRVCVSIELHEIISAAAPLEDWEAAASRYAALAEEALDHGALGHARRAYNLASFVRWQHGHFSGALEQTLQSERAARGATDEEQIIGMADTAKCLVMIERDLSQADAMLMEAQARAARRNLRHASIPAGLGMLRYYENRLDEAEELFREARTLCKSAGDRLNEYQANEYLVMIAIQRADFEETRRRCAELREIGRRLREGSEAPFADVLDGLCTYALEDDSAPLDAALEELRIADAKHRLAYVLTRAALLDHERGRTDAAAARATEALACAEVLQRATEMMLAHLVLGLVLRAAGRDAEAERHAAQIAALKAAGVAAWAAAMAEPLAPRRRQARA
jgi:DNA-binding SARP family transcriptional activator